MPIESFSSTFGDLLKFFRKRKKLTQQALADLLGVHRNTIGVWERGSFLPESKTLILETARLLALDESETRMFLEASLTSLVPRWCIPLPRNPFFTGREPFLSALHQALGGRSTGTSNRLYALRGLGGVGKTQVALEYAYRYALEYTAVLWVRADNAERICASHLKIAELLQLPVCRQTDPEQIAQIVQRWLSTHTQWLMIWDNVQNLHLLQRFLPSMLQDAILLTTRLQALGTLAQSLELPTMAREEGVHFLLYRTKLLPPEASNEQRSQLSQRLPGEYRVARQLVTEMDGLPLALDQVGAYVEASSCSLQDYLEFYRRRGIALLKRRGDDAVDHPASVVTTWSLAFEQIEHTNASAANLLRVCAFLYPEAIPEELFREEIEHPGDLPGPVVIDAGRLHEALRTILMHSLLKYQAGQHTLSIH